MIASNGLTAQKPARHIRNSALSQVPQRSFGDTSWVSLALQNCAEFLVPAIRSGKSHKIVNAVRAIAHAPTSEQVYDVINAACDTVLGEAYAVHDSHLISEVTAARSIIGTVVAEVEARNEREALAGPLLRETVDTYVRLIGLVDKLAAQRLDAIGDLAVRIGRTMHQSSSTLLDIEIAGRLCAVGTLASADSDTQPAHRSHPVIGETFLLSVPSLAHVAPIVRSHQEWFDGRGGPDGLAGEEIPFASRVIGVAATFVELVTGCDRQEPIAPTMACRKLAAAAGTRFDPRIVSATLTLLRFRQRTNRSA